MNPNFVRDFINEVTSGSYLTVRVSGGEPPWTGSLAGTTAVCAPFMHCAESVAPNFVATVNQEYNPFAPPQPYARAPQPYVVAPQPYVPTPQAYTAVPHAPPAPQGLQPNTVSQPIGGIGKEVLQKAEQTARDRCLTGICLWTASWQAPEFYRKLGFEQFAEFDNFPPGRRRIGFRKYL